jgi:hypothetical protein
MNISSIWAEALLYFEASAAVKYAEAAAFRIASGSGLALGAGPI